MTSIDPAPAPELRALGISKTFGGTHALIDVDFEVGKGEVHALLGGNGSGKSTLIKILAGVHQADAGDIEVAGHQVPATHTTPGWAYTAGLRFVHQDTGTFPDHTVAENFALGSSYGRRSLAKVDWTGLNRRVAETLKRFDLDINPDAQMGSLRAADQTLVAVARALDGSTRSSVLVLDEPTASLPPREVEQVYEAIRGYVRHGHTVVLVSHRIDDVLAVATHATFLRDGRRIATRRVREMDERSIIVEMAGPDLARDARRTSTATADGEPRLRVRNLAAGAAVDVSFDVRAGEVLGIAGLAGSGRSSVLRSIVGLTPHRGEIHLDGRALDRGLRPDQAIGKGIAYVPEDRGRDSAFPDRSVRENLVTPRLGQFWRRGRMRLAAERAATDAAMVRYGVVPRTAEAPISTLSGGNQQKVVFARWLEVAPRVLLLDEPTQGVDIAARNGLHEQVRAAADSGMAVVLVSSDARELADLSDRVVALKNGRIGAELRGAALTPRACVEAAYGVHQASSGVAG